MKIAKLVLVAIFVTGVFSPDKTSQCTAYGAEPQLSNFFSHPFDAHSTSQDANGNLSTTHTVSDGMGHIRTETKAGTAVLISIYDHASSTLTTIRETDKVMMSNKIPPYLMEPDEIPKTNLKDLGSKTVNGHPCKGEAYHFVNTDFQVWHGLDINNYTVKSTSVRNGVQTVTQLDSYKAEAPDPSVFVIPTTGYTLQTSAK